MEEPVVDDDKYSMVSSDSANQQTDEKSGESDAPLIIMENGEKGEAPSPEDAEVANVLGTDQKVNIEKLKMGKFCAGLFGDLEARTCANPHAAEDEVRFLKKVKSEKVPTSLRIRPRTPVRQIAKRNRLDAIHATTEVYKLNVEKYTKLLSPVCGDDTLARLLMSGFDYASPMSRAIQVPLLSRENDEKDDELESEPCNECIFCQRENVRHHKTRQDEHPVIRQLRSPCRCFHECMVDENDKEDEPGGKQYIMERFLRDKNNHANDRELKAENQIKSVDKRENAPNPTENMTQDECEKIEHIENETSPDDIQIVVCQTDEPTGISQPIIGRPISSDSRKRSCHSEIHNLPPKRVSVIMQNAENDTCYYSGPSGSQYNQSPVPMFTSASGRSQGGPSGFKQQYLSPESNGVIKIEHPSSLEAYGMYPYRPSNASSSTSSRANYTIPGNGQESRNFFGSRGRDRMSHDQMSHFTVQPHQQQVYTQEDVNRMLTPGHPPRIRACVERLAARFSVSRSRPEHNEKQVTELLQLACEVRRDEECETFYCTWKDCIKHFNRRDSLVRHLRVHVNVRPFKCERCDQRFLRSDHLRVHMLRHTGEQPFACIVCGITFGRKDLRNRHMKTTHYRDERPPQRVLDLLEGTDWDSIEIDDRK